MLRRSTALLALALLAGTLASVAAGPAGAAPAAQPGQFCSASDEGKVELDPQGRYVQCQLQGSARRWVVVAECPTQGSNPPATPIGTGKTGYWMLGRAGEVYPFGDAVDHGDIVQSLADRSEAGIVAVDIEVTPSGDGYWVLDSQGCVHDFGNAGGFGQVNIADLDPGERVTTISTPPNGVGYWVFTSRGRVIPFSPVTSFGDVSNLPLNGPVIDSIATTDGMGYYLVGSDGGVFAFGNAIYYGSTGDQRLNAPVVGLVPDPDGVGYWFVAADGGVFAYQAGFRGSIPQVLAPGTSLNLPIIGMVAYGNGYLMVSSDGGIFTFSNKPFKGSLGSTPIPAPIVSVTVLET
jgi:hypothetical protein